MRPIATTSSPSVAGRGGRGLVRDGIVYGIAITLQRGLSFLLLPAATRVMSQTEFGVASAGLAVAGLLSMIFSFGISFAIVRLYYDEPEDAERTEWAMLVRVQVILGVVLAAAVWASGPLWSRMFEGIGWAVSLQLAVVYGALTAIQSTSLSVLRASRRPLAFTLASVVQIAVGGTLAIVLARRDGAAGFFAGLAIGAGCSAFLGHVATYRRPAWSWRGTRGALLLSIPFVAHMLSQWVFNLSDRVLIERFLGLDELARYHVAYALGMAPMLILDASQAAWGPHYYGSLTSAQKKALPEAVVVPAAALVGLLTGILVAGAPVLAVLVAPDGFSVPVLVIAVVAATACVRTPYMLGFTALADVKSSGPIARASALAATLNLALNVALVPRFGLNAAATTTLASFALMSFIVVRRAERALDTNFRLGALAGTWSVVAVGLAGIALVPDTSFGVAIRATIAIGLFPAVWAAGRVVRRRYRLVTNEGGAQQAAVDSPGGAL